MVCLTQYFTGKDTDSKVEGILAKRNGLTPFATAQDSRLLFSCWAKFQGLNWWVAGEDLMRFTRLLSPLPFFCDLNSYHTLAAALKCCLLLFLKRAKSAPASGLVLLVLLSSWYFPHRYPLTFYPLTSSRMASYLWGFPWPLKNNTTVPIPLFYFFP